MNQAPQLTEADKLRLGAQLQSVIRCMSDMRWRTLRQISDETGAPEASVSARLREIEAKGYGRKQTLREPGGLWQYKIVPIEPSGQHRLF